MRRETTRVMHVWLMKTHLLLTLLAVFTTVLTMLLFLHFLSSAFFLNRLPKHCELFLFLLLNCVLVFQIMTWGAIQSMLQWQRSQPRGNLQMTMGISSSHTLLSFDKQKYIPAVLWRFWSVFLFGYLFLIVGGGIFNFSCAFLILTGFLSFPGSVNTLIA